MVMRDSWDNNYCWNMDIVINYSEPENLYKIYEPTSSTLLMSADLTEGLLNLNKFLKSIGKIQDGSDLLKIPDIEYHIDSHTMNSIIKSNVNLIQRLRQGPSEFKIANDKFGKTSGAGSNYKKKSDFRGTTSKSLQKKQLGYSDKSSFGNAKKRWMR